MFFVIGKKELTAVACLAAAVMSFHLAAWQSRGEARTVMAPSEAEVRPLLILDAGHGGGDGGAVSPDGVKESDINLAVAKETERLLRFLGFSVLMTRSEDISLHDPGSDTVRQQKVSDLKNRVETVNSHRPAVLISIHQNSLPSVPSVHGAQAFWGPVEGSQQLGEGMQALFNRHINTHRGKAAKAADPNLYLLRHAETTSVLVECGFLSNGAETALLQDSNYQKKLALLIGAGYLQWMTGEGRSYAE